MIYRRGAAVLGFTLGAADPYAQAASDLADLQNSVTQGDILIASANFAGAIQTYQTAGANAVTVLGPEIDAVGAPQVTQPHTQHAQLLNDKLAIPVPAPATVTDATAARVLIGTMLDDYLTAIREGRTVQNVAPDKHVVWPLVTIPLGIAAIVGGIMRMRKHPTRQRK